MEKPGDQRIFDQIDSLLLNLHLVQPRLHKKTPSGWVVGVAPLQCSICWAVDTGCKDATEKVEKYRDFYEGFGKLSVTPHPRNSNFLYFEPFPYLMNMEKIIFFLLFLQTLFFSVNNVILP